MLLEGVAPMEIPTDFTHMLHMLRTQELCRTDPPAGGVMVSVGCNGLEYFEWIESNLGHVATHVGLEFYLPRPKDLPANVQWIANTSLR